MLPILALLMACKVPPPAPEGLNEATRYLYRNFYASDDEVGAGLTGLMNWFDEDGDALLDERADLKNVGAFSLEDLEPEDIAHLDMDRDPKPGKAAGVVALADMRCHWAQAERLLVRPDQGRVFEGSLKNYHREYLTSRSKFENAAVDEDFEKIKDTVRPRDLDSLPSTILLTENSAEGGSFGITIPFDLVLQFRHGIFDVQGEKTPALLIMGFLPHRGTSDGGKNAMEQNYSIEVEVYRADKKTLRVYANWLEVTSPYVKSDSPLVLTAAVNGAQDTSERLSKICSGEIDL